MNEELKRIAVYGSLRKGMYNHRLIENAQYVTQDTVTLPFKMVSLGSFPGLIKDEEYHKIVCEFYDLNPSEYHRVEILEGYPSFYDKYTFEHDSVPTEIYVLSDKYIERGEHKHIEDWKKYQRNN